MSEFWGYPGAHILSIIVLVGLSLTALYCARIFVNKL